MRIAISFLVSAISVLLFLSSARAETIEFSEDELATESVLPVFDKTVVVRDRLVTTAGRFEASLGGGLNLAEALYNQLTFDLVVGYHFDEVQGVNIMATFLSSSLSSAGNELYNGQGLATGVTFDAALAPTVQEMVFANYDFTAYYGKISITKQYTMNLSLYGMAGLGVVKWTDVSKIGADFGIGQKLWFNAHNALRFDLFMTVYQGPDPTQPNGGFTQMYKGNGPQPSSAFASTTYVRPFLTAGYVYLF